MNTTDANLGRSTDTIYLTNHRSSRLNPWRGATMVARVFALLSFGLGIFGTLGVLQPVVGISQTMSSLVGQLGPTSFWVMFGVGYGCAGVLTLLSIWCSRKAKGPSINTQTSEKADLQLKGAEENLYTEPTKHKKIVGTALGGLFYPKDSALADKVKKQSTIAAEWINGASVPEGECWCHPINDVNAVFVVNDGTTHYIYAGPQKYITNMLLGAKYEVLEKKDPSV